MSSIPCMSDEDDENKKEKIKCILPKVSWLYTSDSTQKVQIIQNNTSVENAIKEECSDDQTATEKECTSDENDKDCKKKGKLNDRAYKVKGKDESKRQHLN